MFLVTKLARLATLRDKSRANERIRRRRLILNQCCYTLYSFIFYPLTAEVEQLNSIIWDFSPDRQWKKEEFSAFDACTLPPPLMHRSYNHRGGYVHAREALFLAAFADTFSFSALFTRCMGKSGWRNILQGSVFLFFSPLFSAAQKSKRNPKSFLPPWLSADVRFLFTLLFHSQTEGNT